MGFEQDDVDMTANFWCNSCSFVTSSEEIFKIHQMKCNNTEEAMQNMEVEVKMTDFALRAHSDKKERDKEVEKYPRESEVKKGIEFKAELSEEDKAKLRGKTYSRKKTTELQKRPLFPQQSQSRPSQHLQVLQFSPFDLKVITEISLSSMVLGDYLVIVKSDFDMVISEEPYLALMLLLNMVTGKYIARVWNQTVATGILSSVDELKVACLKHFENRPCMGFPVPENEHNDTDSNAPVPIKVSKSCLKVLSKNVKSEIVSCSECLKLIRSKESKLQASEQVKKLAGASPTKTTTQTCTRNMPWGSGLRTQVIKRETRERWLQEYNDSENFPLKFVSYTEVRCETCDTNFTAKKSTVKSLYLAAAARMPQRCMTNFIKGFMLVCFALCIFT